MSGAVDAGNSRGRASKKEILKAASGLFGEVGFHEASLRDIATRVGMTHPGLLHHFPTKKILLAEVLAFRDEQDFAAMERHLNGGEIDYDQALVQVATWNASRPGVVALFATLSAEATTSDHPAHAFFVERYATLLERLEEFYTQLDQAGTLRSDVAPKVAAKTVLALMDGLQIQWLFALESGNQILDVDMGDIIAQYLNALRR